MTCWDSGWVEEIQPKHLELEPAAVSPLSHTPSAEVFKAGSHTRSSIVGSGFRRLPLTPLLFSLSQQPHIPLDPDYVVSS